MVSAAIVPNGNISWNTARTYVVVQILGGGIKNAPQSVARLVGFYITAAYWFTSSTSFANPAVTIARMFSESFAGISPQSVLPFIVAQAAGDVAGYIMATHLFTQR